MKTVGEFITLQRGTTYRGDLVGKPGPALLGLGSIEPGGGFRANHWKTFGGECPEKLTLGPGDLYVALKGATKDGSMIGSVARVPPSIAVGRLTQDTVKLEFREHNTDFAKYIYWLLRTPHYRDYCAGRAIGTTSVALNRADFLAYPVPPMTTQSRHLVALFEAIDERIELNRRMNRTLESLARAIFESWFVDFDPVRGRAAGKTGTSRDPAGVFPHSMVPSLLGPIPEGWRVATIGDVAVELEAGSRPAGGVGGIGHGVPSIGAESIVGIGRFDFAKTKYVTRDFWSGMRRGHVKDFDVLVYKDGGRPGMFEPHATLVGDGFPFSECCINEHVYRLRVSNELSQVYIYFWLTSEFAMGEMRERGTGVAIPSLNSTAFRAVPVLVPDAAIVESFFKVVGPLVAAILANAKQSLTLLSTRDALLPDLLRGELHVRGTQHDAPRAREVIA